MRLLRVWLTHGDGGEQATIVDSNQTSSEALKRRCHTISFCYRPPILPSTHLHTSRRDNPLLREIRSPQTYPLGAHRRLQAHLQRSVGHSLPAL